MEFVFVVCIILFTFYIISQIISQEIRVNNLPTIEREASVVSKRRNSTTTMTPPEFMTDANGNQTMTFPPQTQTNYYIEFQFEHGNLVEFAVSKKFYDSLHEGDRGKLSSKEDIRFVDFQKFH
ncbi:DUF2500 domain-containing protein [Nostoc sp.]|uniref:DUF2500 domain-containing protein n=1 Tax=Nostoc sp. TaxID=1180 RepID=UPI003594881B